MCVMQCTRACLRVSIKAPVNAAGSGCIGIGTDAGTALALEGLEIQALLSMVRPHGHVHCFQQLQVPTQSVFVA